MKNFISQNWSQKKIRMCRTWEAVHMVVCHVDQEASAPHLWYIDRKNNNAIFAYM